MRPIPRGYRPRLSPLTFQCLLPSVLVLGLLLTLLPAPAAAQGVILPPPRCFDIPVPLPLPEPIPMPAPDPSLSTSALPGATGAMQVAPPIQSPPIFLTPVPPII